MTEETPPPKYLNLRNGQPTTGDDETRGIWFGLCTYWTDDWNKVDTSCDIPQCPKCGSPGFQGTAKEWFDGVKRFQAEGNPGYVAFVAQSMSQCIPRMKFIDWYRDWLKLHPNGRVTNPRSDGS